MTYPLTNRSPYQRDAISIKAFRQPYAERGCVDAVDRILELGFLVRIQPVGRELTKLLALCPREQLGNFHSGGVRLQRLGERLDLLLQAGLVDGPHQRAQRPLIREVEILGYGGAHQVGLVSQVPHRRSAGVVDPAQPVPPGLLAAHQGSRPVPNALQRLGARERLHGPVGEPQESVALPGH